MLQHDVIDQTNENMHNLKETMPYSTIKIIVDWCRSHDI